MTPSPLSMDLYLPPLEHMEINHWPFHSQHRGRTYQGGYVAEYREEQELTPGTEELPWMRKEVPIGELQPKLTVEGLQPNTLYEVSGGRKCNIIWLHFVFICSNSCLFQSSISVSFNVSSFFSCYSHPTFYICVGSFEQNYVVCTFDFFFLPFSHRLNYLTGTLVLGGM